MILRPITSELPKAAPVVPPSFQENCECADLCVKLKEQDPNGQLKNWSKKYDVTFCQDKDGNAIAVAIFDNSGTSAALAFQYDKDSGKFADRGVAQSELQMLNIQAPLENYARAKGWLLLNPKLKGEERQKREAIVAEMEAKGFKSSEGCIKFG